MDFEFTDNQKLFKATLSHFVDDIIIPHASEIDEKARFPEENFKAMAGLGLFGISIPPEYGGNGEGITSAIKYSRIGDFVTYGMHGKD